MAFVHFPMTPRRGSGVYNCGLPKRAFSLDSVVGSCTECLSYSDFYL